MQVNERMNMTTNLRTGDADEGLDHGCSITDSSTVNTIRKFKAGN